MPTRAHAVACLADTQAPYVTGPANGEVTLEANEPNGKRVDPSEFVTATDGTITCDPPAGSFLAMGPATPVTCTAADAAGNQARVAFSILVGECMQAHGPSLVAGAAYRSSTYWHGCQMLACKRNSLASACTHT